MKNDIKPKTLLIDIETQPNLAWVWGKWEQNVIEFKQEWSIISFAYKWLGEKRINVWSIDDFKDYKTGTNNDEKLLKKIWELFNEAEIIIAHNGDNFDIKKINARFIYNKLTPPTPYKTIDTLKLAKKYFSFTSNKLNDIGKYLKLGEKIKTGGFDLWLQCIAGNKSAWKLMRKYNKMDVILLEKVYNKLSPWMKSYPKLIDPKGDDPERVCNSCGKQMIKNGIRRCVDYAYVRLYCSGCGHWQRGESVSIEDKKCK